MLDQNHNNEHDPNNFAFNAILSLADSKRSDVPEFLDYLKQNRFSPIARMHGLPVYRLADFLANAECYMSNEKTASIPAELTTLDFSLFGEFLVFSGDIGRAGGERESFIVSQDIINVAVKALNKTPLTPAECRIVAQLISGTQLKKAAAEDELSLETKRTQVRSAISKLDVSRQQDLIRVLLPELVRLTSPASWDKEGQRIFNRYANEFLPESVRCQKLSDKEGRSVRIIDFGPLRGRPVIILHSMIFPDITEDDVQFANDHNLRLIWPLRPGLLETSPLPKPTTQYAEETLQGIDLAWEHMCGEPVPVIAMVSSAWHAAAYAQLNPEKVSDITFAATCFSAGKYENSLVYFGSSVAELCSRNVWLMTKTVDFIRSNVRDPERFKSTILRAFNGSDPDVEVLNQEFESANGVQRLIMALVDSPESVKHDYFNQVSFRWSSLGRLRVPFKFIHGAHDSLHKISDVKRLLSKIDKAPLQIAENSGHIMQYKHFHNLLSRSLDL